MDYTVKELHRLSRNTLCERQIRRRCNILHTKYPNYIRKTTNRMWLVNEKVVDEVIKRKNNRVIDSQIINLGKQITSTKYNTIKETLDEIRQEYDSLEWNYFTGFRPKNRYTSQYLFNLVKFISEELERRTKMNVSLFYAIEMDKKKVYHVHMAINGNEQVKKVLKNIFRFQLKELDLKLLEPQEFNLNHHDSCYKYFSKEYFIDDNMRIGIIKK